MPQILRGSCCLFVTFVNYIAGVIHILKGKFSVSLSYFGKNLILEIFMLLRIVYHVHSIFECHF